MALIPRILPSPFFTPPVAMPRAHHQPAFVQVVPAWQVRVAAVLGVGAALAAAGVHAVGILEGLCVPRCLGSPEVVG